MAHLSYKQYIEGGNPPGLTNWVKFNWIQGGAPLTSYRYISIGNTVGGYDTDLGNQKLVFTKVLRESADINGYTSKIGLSGANNDSTYLQSNSITPNYRLLLPLPDDIGYDEMAQYMVDTLTLGTTSDNILERIQSMIDKGYYVGEKTSSLPSYWFYDAALPVHVTEE